MIRKKVAEVEKVEQVVQDKPSSKARGTRDTRATRGTPPARTMDELLSKTGYKIRSFARGERVLGKIIDIGPKSLILDIGAKSEGIIADREFEAARHLIKELNVGDEIEAQVLVPEQNGQVFLTLRETAEKHAWDILNKKLKEGEEVEARVEGLAKGGLAVSVFGLKGYIPGSHLGGRVSKNPGVLVGRNVKVKVLELDREKERVILSEKAVSEAELIAAQEKVLEKIKKGEVLPGKVVGIAGFGAFVQIDKEGVLVDGLVHLSELSWQKVSSPSEVVKAEEEVKVVVIGKETTGPGVPRLALSIKQAQEDPWEKVEEKYKKETRVSGNVVKLGDFGAIVEIEPGIEGLVHLSKIPAGISLKEGTPVECFVEKIDKKNRRISLGLVLKAKPVGYK